MLEARLGLLTFLAQRATLAECGRDTRAAVSNTSLLVVGAVTGVLSSISGAGGPLVLVPLAISMSIPVLIAIGLSQVIQLSIAIAATIGNTVYGQIDLVLGGVLVASLTIGSWYGAKLAHVVPRATQRHILAVAVAVVGTFIFANVVWRLVR